MFTCLFLFSYPVMSYLILLYIMSPSRLSLLCPCPAIIFKPHTMTNQPTSSAPEIARQRDKGEPVKWMSSNAKAESVLVVRE